MFPFFKTFTSLHAHHWSLPTLGSALAGVLVLGGCAAGPEASRPDAQRSPSPNEAAVAPTQTENAYRDDGAEKSLLKTKAVCEPVGTVPEATERQKRRAAAETPTVELRSAANGWVFTETTDALVPNDVRETGRIWSSGFRGGTHARTALEIEQTVRPDEGFTFVYGQGWDADQMDRARRQATWTTLDKITKRIKDKLPKHLLAEASSAMPKQ